MTLSNFCENIKFVGLFLKLFSGWQGTFHIISNKNPETINSFIAVLYEINQELWHDDKLKKNLEAWQYLQHFWSDKYVKGTVVNKTWSFLHGGSHEITLTVRVKGLFIVVLGEPLIISTISLDSIIYLFHHLHYKLH